MKGRWKYVVFAIILIVVLLLLLRGQSTVHRIVLPDGTQLILREVTFGTNHRYVAGNIFQRSIARFLPKRLKGFFHIKELTIAPRLEPPDLQTLVAWVERKPATNVVLRVSDGAGHEQPVERANAATVALGANARISGHVFASFPRRSRFLRLRAYSPTVAGQNLRGEFRVENPAYRKYPSWTPEPLPITRETNGVTFTLTRFETGVQPTPAFASMSSEWTELEFDYGPHGVISGPWNPTLVEIKDATGNVIRQTNPRQRFGTGPRPPGNRASIDLARRGMVSLPAMLWLDEPAWEIRLDLERTARSAFQSNEIWQVNDVPIPAIGESNYVGQSVSRYATNVTFVALAQATNISFVSVVAEKTRNIKVTLDYPSASGVRVHLLKVTDQRGRNLGFSNFYVYPPPSASERLNFQFAIHQLVSLRFLAKPSLATTNIINPENSLLDPVNVLGP